MSKAGVLGPSRAASFQRDICKMLREVADGRRNLRETFESFVLLSACACSAGAREEEYMAEISRWDKPAADGFAECFALLIDCMEADPFKDMLGPIYMELGSSSTQKWGGEFYTSHEVVRMMAKLTVGDVTVPLDRPVSFCEPASGSGGMMLACAEHMVERGFSPLNMEVTCMDISKLACDMCYVNLSLCGIPAQIVHGNTLSLQTWGGWRTVTWAMRKGLLADKDLAFYRLLKGIVQDVAPSADPISSVIGKEEQTEIAKDVQAAVNAKGQFGFSFDEVAA